MPVGTRLYWILGLAVTAIIVIAIWRGIVLTRNERELVRTNVVQMRTLDRAGMNSMWHVKVIKPFQFSDKYEDRILWYPATTSTLALAITPRHATSDFDAIFTLFEGERVRAIFALTPQGMFFNELEADPRQYPGLQFPRVLTADELADLAQLTALIAEHQAGLDPQSPRARWLTQVLQIAREIHTTHAATGGQAKQPSI